MLNSVIPLSLARLWHGLISDKLHQNIPHGDNMAHTAEEYEEVKDRVHVFALMLGIEQGTRDVSHALGNDPYHGTCRHAIDQRFECYEHTQPHADVSQGLDVTVSFEMTERGDGSQDGTEPHENEQSPSPQALLAQGDECDR